MSWRVFFEPTHATQLAVSPIYDERRGADSEAARLRPLITRAQWKTLANLVTKHEGLSEETTKMIFDALEAPSIVVREVRATGGA